MKVTPLPYYICDYCGTGTSYPSFKYTDNSGLNNQCYDMCSDECFEKHIEMLKATMYKNNGMNEDGYTLEQHMKEMIWSR